MPSAADSATTFILRPRVRLVLAWCAAIIATAGHAWTAWHSYDTNHLRDDPTKARVDGNFGHMLVDFASQWLNARLLIESQGRDLYSRTAQRNVIDGAFPRADEAPQAKESDADSLYGWLIEVGSSSPQDRALGGALYPPTQALLFAPIGYLSPRAAYRTCQVGLLMLIWLSAWMLTRISDGRIWWPVAVLFLCGYPGIQGALHLAQNSLLSLTILVAGWLLVAQRRDFLGGLVWSLLAFKPTWAVAFALVPLLTRRWAMALGMALGGLALVAATLPFVGIQAWQDWWTVGRAAAHAYALDENWVFLSRDLLNVPRRWLLDFHIALDDRDRVVASVIGWALWALVLGITTIVALRRPRAGVVGPAAAFVGLGAWLSCFHFIYYDTLLSAFPVFLLLTEARLAWPTLNIKPFVFVILVFLVVYEMSFAWLAFEYPSSSLVPWFSTKQHGTPWDTFALVALWAYCGVTGGRTNCDAEG